MFIILIIGLLLLIFISLFAFPKLSPIPYFPSNKKDIALIIRSLGLKDNQVVIDLGAGDGLVVFEAAEFAYARRLNAQFIAVEINPMLLILLQIKRLFNRNRKNIKVVQGDMFKLNYEKLLPKLKTQNTFYLYISPWYLEKTVENIKNYLKTFYIVSYMYQLPKRKEIKKLKGKHPIFTYKF